MYGCWCGAMDELNSTLAEWWEGRSSGRLLHDDSACVLNAGLGWCRIYGNCHLPWSINHLDLAHPACSVYGLSDISEFHTPSLNRFLVHYYAWVGCVYAISDI